MVLLDIVYLSMNRDKTYRNVTPKIYGGHHAGDRTTHKVFQSGVYWPALFKDAHKVVYVVMNVKE